MAHHAFHMPHVSPEVFKYPLQVLMVFIILFKVSRLYKKLESLESEVLKK